MTARVREVTNVCVLDCRPLQSDLILTDGCGGGVVVGTAGGNCTAFNSGIFTVGLHPTLINFIRRTTMYVDGIRTQFQLQQPGTTTPQVMSLSGFGLFVCWRRLCADPTVVHFARVPVDPRIVPGLVTA